MPGVRCARSLAYYKKTKYTSLSHHEYTGITRHSPRDGFNVYLVLFPVLGLVGHRRLRCFTQT